MFLHEEKRSLNTESDGRNQPQQPRRRTIRPSPVAIRAGCASEVCERGLLGKRKDGRQAEDVCLRWFGLLMGNRGEWFKKICFSWCVTFLLLHLCSEPVRLVLLHCRTRAHMTQQSKHPRFVPEHSYVY